MLVGTGNFRTGSGAYPASFSMGTRVFPGATWPGREVYHSPLSSARVKNEWSCTSASHIHLLGMDRGSFTFG